jgi:hypothetical protein
VAVRTAGVSALVERRLLFGFEEAFGLRGHERERDVEMETSGTNAKRGSAPETAFGSAAGGKL